MTPADLHPVPRAALYALAAACVLVAGLLIMAVWIASFGSLALPMCGRRRHL